MVSVFPPCCFGFAEHGHFPPGYPFSLLTFFLLDPKGDDKVGGQYSKAPPIRREPTRKNHGQSGVLCHKCAPMQDLAVTRPFLTHTRSHIHGRQFFRAPADRQAITFEQIAYRGLGEIHDISEGGVRIQSIDRFERGAVRLGFKLPSFSRREYLSGSIVWVDEKTFSCGVVFHLVPNNVAALLRSYIRSRL